MRQFTSRWSASVVQLANAGFSTDDAYALRRISMTLHRWHELECGDAYGNCIERDETTGKCYATWDLNMSGKRGRTLVRDREMPALKRLAKIMARYPGFASYVQGDPRGCALYILTPEVLAGLPNEKDSSERNLSGYYNRGIAVHK